MLGGKKRVREGGHDPVVGVYLTTQNRLAGRRRGTRDEINKRIDAKCPRLAGLNEGSEYQRGPSQRLTAEKEERRFVGGSRLAPPGGAILGRRNRKSELRKRR